MSSFNFASGDSCNQDSSVQESTTSSWMQDKAAKLPKKEKNLLSILKCHCQMAVQNKLTGEDLALKKKEELNPAPMSSEFGGNYEPLSPEGQIF